MIAARQLALDLAPRLADCPRLRAAWRALERRNPNGLLSDAHRLEIARTCGCPAHEAMRARERAAKRAA